MRTPSWDFSWNTLAIAAEMGLLYDSSLMSDEDCYELLLDGNPCGVVELPVEWVRDDAVYFMMNRFSALRPYTPPADVFDIFRREFEAAYDEGGIFQLTMHPHVIGYRSRIWIIEELIRLAGRARASGSPPTPRWRNGQRSTPGELNSWPARARAIANRHGLAALRRRDRGAALTAELWLP